MTDFCRECKHPVVEIDNRGTRLTGCMTCNIWWTGDDKKVRLSEEDLGALHFYAAEDLKRAPRRYLRVLAPRT